MPLLLAPATEPPDLRDRLIDLRRRWRRLVVLHGLAALATLALGTALAVGLLDRASNAPALVRALALVAALVAGGLFLRDRALRPWRELGDELAVALRVENRFPALNDALASTVQFERSPLGSDALRRATYRRAARQAEDCDLAELL